MNGNLQDTYGPDTTCFGCGPANERGLQIKSFVDGAMVIAEFMPEPHHQAFPGVINGGIIGSLLDCHSNWTAAWSIMQGRDDDQLPVTVTADFHVKLREPTPAGVPLHLSARVVDLDDPKAIVEATLEADGKVCATCRATFIAVEEGHPAYHRW